MSYWQPIAEAPKDGTIFIATRDIGEYCDPYKCWYEEGHPYNDGYCDDSTMGRFKPVYFIPMPLPPK